jgi:hypothetical protein
MASFGQGRGFDQHHPPTPGKMACKPFCRLSKPFGQLGISQKMKVACVSYTSYRHLMSCSLWQIYYSKFPADPWATNSQVFSIVLAFTITIAANYEINS